MFHPQVHINDPDFYDEVYVSGSKRKTERWAWAVGTQAVYSCEAFDS